MVFKILITQHFIKYLKFTIMIDQDCLINSLKCLILMLSNTNKIPLAFLGRYY
jgi:hypothetical protein